jgi:hypothetical protein
MSSTDMLNGPTEGLPTYNVKNNCTVENLNSAGQITNITPLFYAILQNQQFLDVILRLKNTARHYYNSNRKNFCSTVNLSSVNGFNQERITVFLPTAGGNLLNDPCYVNYDYTHNTLLMRILPTGVLPTNWSNVVGQSSSVPVNMLTDNEKILYMYIKNADFFTRVLQLFKNSFQYYATDKYQCFVLKFPSDFYEGSESERTFTITSDYLRTIYRNYLANPQYIPYQSLPAPICVTVPAPCDAWDPSTQTI